jgi:PncC family amidohydrolase
MIDAETRKRAADVIAQFQTAGWRLSIAESCTGGLIASTITGESGSSAVLDMCIVAYANDAKEKLLNVPKQTMIEQGAVSAEVARLMAGHVKNIVWSDVSLGVTGVAGPGGGTADKPVGRIYLHISSPLGEHALEHDFQGDRDSVRAQTVTGALEVLLALAKAGSP